MRRQLEVMVISQVSDTTAPTVAITSAAVSPVIAAFTVTFTLSEVSTDFVLADITVGNGTAGTFSGSGTSYTAVITPTAGGAVTVDVAEGAFHDAAGNGNAAATQFSRTFYDVKVDDAFTDTNGTALSAHTISPTNVPGNAWVNILTTSGRVVTIQSNKAVSKQFAEDDHVGLEVGAADVVLSVVITPATSTIVNSVLLRMDNLTDITARRFCWSIEFGNGVVSLNERNNAAPGTVRASANLTTTGGVAYTIQAVCSGNQITVTVDGANSITYTTTTHQTSTKFGLSLIGESGGGATSKADDFKVFF